VTRTYSAWSAILALAYGKLGKVDSNLVTPANLRRCRRRARRAPPDLLPADRPAISAGRCALRSVTGGGPAGSRPRACRGARPVVWRGLGLHHGLL